MFSAASCPCETVCLLGLGAKIFSVPLFWCIIWSRKYFAASGTFDLMWYMRNILYLFQLSFEQSLYFYSSLNEGQTVQYFSAVCLTLLVSLLRIFLWWASLMPWLIMFLRFLNMAMNGRELLSVWWTHSVLQMDSIIKHRLVFVWQAKRYFLY